MSDGEHWVVVRRILGPLRDDIGKLLERKMKKDKVYGDIVRVWEGLIIIGGFDSASCQSISDKLVSLSMTSRDEDLCVAVFGVVLQGNKESELVVPLYVALGDKISSSGLKQMDAKLGQTVKKSSAEDFERFLSFVVGLFEDEESRLVHLVHLALVLVRHHHPSHSIGAVRKFMTRCLGLFNDRVVYVADSTLRMGVLELVEHYCTHQVCHIQYPKLHFKNHNIASYSSPTGYVSHLALHLPTPRPFSHPRRGHSKRRISQDCVNINIPYTKSEGFSDPRASSVGNDTWKDDQNLTRLSTSSWI